MRLFVVALAVLAFLFSGNRASAAGPILTRVRERMEARQEARAQQASVQACQQGQSQAPLFRRPHLFHPFAFTSPYPFGFPQSAGCVDGSCPLRR